MVQRPQSIIAASNRKTRINKYALGESEEKKIRTWGAKNGEFALLSLEYYLYKEENTMKNVRKYRSACLGAD